MNCDPSDQNKCLLCRSGYYMTENHVCVKNGEKPTDPSTDGGNVTTPDTE